MKYGDGCLVKMGNDDLNVMREFICHLPDGKVLCVAGDRKLLDYETAPNGSCYVWKYWEEMPIPKYKPFTRETFDHRCIWLVDSDGNEYPISKIKKDVIVVGGMYLTWKHILENYTFIDGSVCGEEA